MEINTIGVIGAGTMGCGVTQAFAQHQFRVLLIDETEEILRQAKIRIQNNLRQQIFFSKDKRSVNLEEVLSNIQYFTELNGLQDADFIIENISENFLSKENVYKKINPISSPRAIIAVNSSTIPIQELAKYLLDPSRVLGIHFMNPVPLKNTVEIIRSPKTSEKTIEISINLLHRIGKKGIIVNDSPGFVINRVLMAAINTAIHLLEEKVAGVHEIDELFTECLGHATGPLRTADLIGLDTIKSSLESLYAYYKLKQYIPCDLLNQKVASGMLGQKTGEGFYPYR